MFHCMPFNIFPMLDSFLFTNLFNKRSHIISIIRPYTLNVLHSFCILITLSINTNIIQIQHMINLISDNKWVLMFHKKGFGSNGFLLLENRKQKAKALNIPHQSLTSLMVYHIFYVFECVKMLFISCNM